jgi:UDP-N-acetylglucosamine 1-carboxyvinyltransferase
LTAEPVVIENIPDIIDVNKLITILEHLGVKVQQLGPGTYQFQSDTLDLEYLESE